MAKADEKGIGRVHHCVECCSLLHCARFCLECSPVNDSLRSGPPVCGGQIQFKMQCMTRSLLAALLCATIVFASCSQSTSMQKVADTGTSPLKNRIPPADP